MGLIRCCQVTVFDRRSAPGEGTTKGNACSLRTSTFGPMASPAMVLYLLARYPLMIAPPGPKDAQGDRFWRQALSFQLEGHIY